MVGDKNGAYYLAALICRSHQILAASKFDRNPGRVGISATCARPVQLFICYIGTYSSIPTLYPPREQLLGGNRSACICLIYRRALVQTVS